jgi:hypothetical protein
MFLQGAKHKHNLGGAVEVMCLSIHYPLSTYKDVYIKIIYKQRVPGKVISWASYYDTIIKS